MLVKVRRKLDLQKIEEGREINAVDRRASERAARKREKAGREGGATRMLKYCRRLGVFAYCVTVVMLCA